MSQPPDPNVPPQDPNLPPTTPPPASPPPGAQPPYQPAPPPPSQPELTPMPGYGYPPPPYPPGAIAPGTHLDAESGLVLPDGTQLATVGRRIGGYFLDLLLLIVTLVIGYIIWSLIVWARGQTPAKQLLHMRCWRPETGKNANWGWMFMRQFIGSLVEGIAGGIIFVVSCFMMVLSKQRRAIHDYIGGTVVLSDPNDVLAR